MTELCKNTNSLIDSALAKHYTSKQLTGLTKDEEKKLSILEKLTNYYYANKTPDTDKNLLEGINDVAINRYDLRVSVIDEGLRVAANRTPDRQTALKYIDSFIGEGFLIQNPDSHIVRSKKFFAKPHILPTNDTRYFIDYPLMCKVGNELCAKKYKKGKNIGCVSLTNYLNTPTKQET
jgi:hypothetical protein